jgi:hypothetical protein
MRKKAKQNELGFQEMAAILSPLGLYGGNRNTKLPLRTNTRIHALEGHFGNLCLRSIGRIPATTNFLSLDASSHTGLTGPMLLQFLLRSSVLALLINQGTEWFSGEPPETLQTRCSLCQSALMTRLHVVSAQPWFRGSTKKPSTTSSCRSCHHAART